jgi:hypothetical protein
LEAQIALPTAISDFLNHEWNKNEKSKLPILPGDFR